MLIDLTPFVTLWRVLGLAVAVSMASPGTRPIVALHNACEAVEHETVTVPAEVLLGVAKIESDFDPRAVSRPHGPTTPPYYCSVLQTQAASDAECRRQRDLHVAYQTGVRELDRWRRDRRTHGKVHGILLGHGCGNAGVESGRCNHYPERVLRFARRLQ